VTIPNENKQANINRFPVLTSKTLHAANFIFNSPFAFQLATDCVFVEKIVRILPQKRLVAFGTWQNKPIVAKFFFSSQRAKQHVEKELKGIKLLQDCRVPTPILLEHSISQDKKVHVLIFERIQDAENLYEIWQYKKHTQAILPLLQSVMIELATQHVFGILQHDLHLKNFLVNEKNVYMLDGATVERCTPLLSKKTSMQHLALFLSQLGAGVEDQQLCLFNYYAKLRGWLIKEEDKSELFYLIKQCNEKRWKKFEKKIFRETSHFSRKQDWQTLLIYNRQYAFPEFLAFLQDPESVFQRDDITLLKNGRSSTVIKVTLDQRELVVKRYNMKNRWHHLRRCLRSTRAYASWRLAQKLSLFYLPTPRPVAMIEKKFMKLRGKSYFVTEYVAGEHASDFFTRHAQDEEKTSTMVKRIVALLKGIAKLEITHGDLKMTNVLVNRHEQPVIIDLDSAAEHLSLSSLHRGWKKEIKRLLENFHHLPNVKEKFEQVL